MRAKIAAAQLIQLRERLPSLRHLTKFEVGFSKQVEVLRLVGMLVEFFGQLLEIQFRAVLFGKVGARTHVIEKVLIWVGTWRHVLGKRLEDIQIPLGGHGLMQAPFHHGELVVSRGGILAQLDVFAEKWCGGLELFFLDTQVGEFEQCFRETGFRA